MQSSHENQDLVEPVAIVGLAGRYPGDAADPEKLWDLLCHGRSAMSEVPQDRYNVNGFYHPHGDRAGSINFKGGHYMNRNPAAFDAPFFSITPAEAKAMDPQQRMCLEVAYETLESAGVRMEDIAGSDMACYVGCFSQDYWNLAFRDPETFPKYNACGTADSYLSNRISWFYDLRGPSISIDTACSSSLVALHLACQSIRTGESEAALVGGVNFMISPEINIPMTFLHMLSEDSKSQSFDEKANGYSRGEGCAFVLVKSLSAALRDKDVIRAVIRNTATNQDGKTPGITLPSAQSQEAMMRRAYKQAGLDLADTGYFEAHGTGTPAGDPIEMSALAAVFGSSRKPGNPLVVGSIKSNIGHLEGASGIAGLTKAIYVMERGIIPPQVWLDKVNPKITLDQWNLTIPRTLMKWPRSGLRRISVNSFGFGGANAHCILDDAYHYLESRQIDGFHNTIVGHDSECGSPPSTSSDTDSSFDVSSSTPATPLDQLIDIGPKDGLPCANQIVFLRSRLTKQAPKLLVWSSHEQAGIDRVAQSYSAYLMSQGDVSDEPDLLERFAFTLSCRRSRLPWKTFAISDSVSEASLAMSLFSKPKRTIAQSLKIGMVFTGQGAQHFAMARELFTYKIFSESLSAAECYLESLGCTWKVTTELMRDERCSRINEPAFSQPLCTIIQIAMLDLLESWNIRPAAVVGHSSGEIAAAYAKRALSREDAWLIAYERGRLSGLIRERYPDREGCMLAAGIGEQQAQSYLDRVVLGSAVVACANSPQSVTISGDASAVYEVEKMLLTDNVFARRLKVSTAYHSPHMQVIADEYLQALNAVQILAEDDSAPKMFSSVTGQTVANSDLGPAYWVSNMVGMVKFTHALQSLIQFSEQKSKRRTKAVKSYVNLLLELGPSGALQGPVKQILSALQTDLPSLSALQRGKDAAVTLLQAAGRLFQEGADVDIARANATGFESEGHFPRLLVNMPPHPWNHSHEYWHHTSLAHNYYHRKHPRKDLIGVPSIEQNDMEPRWRTFLRLSENPWLEDHVIQKTLLYPAAGMIVMAIEAMAQICPARALIDGFELLNIDILDALVLSREEEGIETMLHFKLSSAHESDITAWRRFDLYSRRNMSEWSKHCSGHIRAILASPEVDQSKDSQEEFERSTKDVLEGAQKISAQASRQVTPADFYRRSAGLGLDWGPAFQNIKTLSSGNYCSNATISIPDTKSLMPVQHEYDHIIHPCTLDTVVQMLLLATTPLKQDMSTAAIPTHVARLIVSAKIPTTSGACVQGFAITEESGFKRSKSSVVVTDDARQTPYVIMEGVITTKLVSVDGSTDSIDVVAPFRKLAGRIVWNEDVKKLNGTPLLHRLSLNQDPGIDVGLRLHELDIASYIYAKRAISDYTSRETGKLTDHIRQYFNLLCSRINDPQFSNWFGVSYQLEEQMLEKSAIADLEGAIVRRVGENLRSILTGQIDPLTVMMEDDLLREYEIHTVGRAQVDSQLMTLMELLGHQNPDQNIIEIGAKHGSLTDIVLSTLAPELTETPLFSKYTYTDLKPELVDKAAEKYNARSSYMTFQRLNIEKDIRSQNFDEAAYDVVIAWNFTHAVSSLDEALNNARKLLKPGGTLVLVEVTEPGLAVPFVLGSLPAWWMGANDSRVNNPYISTSAWHTRLRANGFDGLQTELPNKLHSKESRVSLIVSRCCSVKVDDMPKELVIVGDVNPVNNKIPQALKNLFESCGTSCRIIPLLEIDPHNLEKKYVIVAIELEKPILFEATDDEFSKIKEIILESAGTLWLSKGAAVECEAPASSLISGLSRTIRSENPGIGLTILDLDPYSPLTTQGNLSAIVEVTKTAFGASLQMDKEFEYAIRNENILIPRVYPDKGTNMLTQALSHSIGMEPIELSNEERSLTLVTDGSAGLNEKIGFVENDVFKTQLAEHEVVIAVRASALDGRRSQRERSIVNDLEISTACTGDVVDVGPAVQNFAIGDRVMAWAVSSVGTHVRVKETFVRRLRQSLTYATGSTIPQTYVTVYHALVSTARVCEGETVLVQDGASNLGQAAIIVARALGCKVIAVVTDQQEKILLMTALGLEAHNILYKLKTTWSDNVKRLVGGVGVDVALCGSDPETLRLSSGLLAWCGRLVSLGTAKSDRGDMDLVNLDRSITLSRIDTSQLLLQAPEKAAKIFGNAMDMVDSIDAPAMANTKILSYSDIDEAVRLLKSDDISYPVVVQRRKDDVVQAIPDYLRPAKLSSEATYLLVGGLGGLGRSLSQMMTDRGARHLAFFSRSGSARPEAAELLQSLKERGINARVYRCDITKADAVAIAVEQCHAEMPPMKGCVQAAMSLADVPFHSMTHIQYRQSVDPKAIGTWNLHKYLPKDMDFMVMLSSLSGIVGTKGQANYAAGNAFMDALSHHRNALGMPTYSFDVGMVLGVGWVADHADVEAGLTRQGFLGLSEQEFLAILDGCITGTSYKKMRMPRQIVTGFGTGGYFKATNAELPEYLDDARWNIIRKLDTHLLVETEKKDEVNIAVQLKEIKTLSGATDVVCAALCTRLARWMMINAEDIDAQKTVSNYGVDSLVAVELRTWAFRDCGSEISVFDVMSKVPIRELAGKIAKKSSHVNQEVSKADN